VRKLCVFLGLVAIAYKLNIGSLLSLFRSETLVESVSILAAAAIAAKFVSGEHLGERIASPQWIVVGFGAAGALVFLFKYFSLASLGMLLMLGIVGSTVVSSALDAVLLLCFLKLAADLKSKAEIGSPTQAGENA
jgi:hypothetical protein